MPWMSVISHIAYLDVLVLLNSLEFYGMGAIFSIGMIFSIDYHIARALGKVALPMFFGAVHLKYEHVQTMDEISATILMLTVVVMFVLRRWWQSMVIIFVIAVIFLVSTTIILFGQWGSFVSLSLLLFFAFCVIATPELREEIFDKYTILWADVYIGLFMLMCAILLWSGVWLFYNSSDEAYNSTHPLWHTLTARGGWLIIYGSFQGGLKEIIATNVRQVTTMK